MQNTSNKRTTNTIESTLAKAERKMAKMTFDPWLGCRLAPWMNTGTSALLPDGVRDPRLAMDLYSYCNVSGLSAGTNFSFIVYPFYPWNAAIVVDSGKLSLGTINAATAVVTVSAAYTQTPCNFTAAATSWVDDPFATSSKTYVNADKGRVTSMGWRLLYTGPVNTCAGIVNVTSSPLTNDPTIPKVKGTISVQGSDLGGVGSIGTATKSVNVIPMSPLGATSSKDMVTSRPEAGLKGIVRHSSSTFPWKEIWEQPVLLTQAAVGVDNVGGNVAAMNSSKYGTTGVYDAVAPTNFGTVQMIDDDWDQVRVSVTGPNTDASFRFETWQCIEFVPNVNSVLYGIANSDTKGSVEVASKLDMQANKSPVAE
jgi:hypothetical protein